MTTDETAVAEDRHDDERARKIKSLAQRIIGGLVSRTESYDELAEIGCGEHEVVVEIRRLGLIDWKRTDIARLVKDSHSDLKSEKFKISQQERQLLHMKRYALLSQLRDEPEASLEIEPQLQEIEAELWPERSAAIA